MNINLMALKDRYPWPQQRPNVPPDLHGWFGECNEYILSLFINDRTQTILELGSWLGKSTRFILQKAPNATVMAVDHWLGTKQITDDAPECAAKLPALYDTFLTNCWDYRNRLIPIKKTTLEAMDEILRLQICPEIVYLDAAHDEKSVKDDLDKAMACFPDAILVGDDFGPKWDGLMRSVWQHAEDHGRGLILASHAWAIVGNWRGDAFGKLRR